MYYEIDACDATVADYVARVPENQIIDLIYASIVDIGMNLDEDEYNYYLAIFEENGC